MALAGAAFLAILNLICFLSASGGYRTAFAVAGVANLLALGLLSNVQ
jgi:hypothetical protein